MRATAIVTVLAACLAAVACDRASEPTAPSGTGAAGPVQVETFTGTLPVGDFKFYSIGVANPGNVYLTLLNLNAGGAAQDTRVGLGLGRPVGTDCLLDLDETATPGSGSQVSGFVIAGTYCARISDIGNLTEPLAFTINIAYPR